MTDKPTECICGLVHDIALCKIHAGSSPRSVIGWLGSGGHHAVDIRTVEEKKMDKPTDVDLLAKAQHRESELLKIQGIIDEQRDTEIDKRCSAEALNKYLQAQIAAKDKGFAKLQADWWAQEATLERVCGERDEAQAKVIQLELNKRLSDAIVEACKNDAAKVKDLESRNETLEINLHAVLNDQCWVKKLDMEHLLPKPDFLKNCDAFYEELKVGKQPEVNTEVELLRERVKDLEAEIKVHRDSQGSGNVAAAIRAEKEKL